MAKLIRFDGQSLGKQMFSVSSGTCTPHADTHMWDPATSAMVPPTGDGAITYANCLREALQEPICLIDACEGGSALLRYGSNDCWSNSSGALFCNAIAQTQAALGSVSGLCLDRVEVVRGQTESYTGGYSNMPGSYYDAEVSCLAAQRAILGNDFRYCIWPVGKVHVGTTANVLKAQMWLTTDSGAIGRGMEPGPAMYDRGYASDSLHLYGPPEYMWMGIRGARNAMSYFVAKANAADTIPHYGAGPVIESLSRHPNNVTKTMFANIAVKNGFCLVPTSQWPYSDTTWLTAFSANAPITDAQLMGGKVKLFSSVALSGPITVSYQGERDCSAANVVYDTNQQWGDQGQPMLPLALGAMTSN